MRLLKVVFTQKKKNWFIRNFCATPVLSRKVCVTGGAGEIGQCLCLLLKLSPLVSELRIHDIRNTKNVTTDLTFIENPVKIKTYHGRDEMKYAFAGSDLILISAGASRKSWLTLDHLLTVNAGFIKEMAAAIAEVAPTALIAIITHPINVVVPMFAKVMDNFGRLSPNKLFGVTTVDSIRANTFVGELKGLNPSEVFVPVVGGTCDDTVVPLVSKCNPPVVFPMNELEMLVKKIRKSSDVVIEAKSGKGSCTLSMAFAAAKFTMSLIKAMNGEENIIECSYVMSSVTRAKFFSTPVLLGRHGIERNLGIPKGITGFEQLLVDKAVGVLISDIDQAERITRKP